MSSPYYRTQRRPRTLLLLALLSWILIVSWITPLAAQSNHDYPRTGVFHFAKARPEWYAQFDLVITSQTGAGFARAIKEISPETIVLASVRDWNTFSRKSVPDEWYVRDSRGNKYCYTD